MPYSDLAINMLAVLECEGWARLGGEKRVREGDKDDSSWGRPWDCGLSGGRSCSGLRMRGGQAERRRWTSSGGVDVELEFGVARQAVRLRSRSRAHTEPN